MIKSINHNWQQEENELRIKIFTNLQFTNHQTNKIGNYYSTNEFVQDKMIM